MAKKAVKKVVKPEPAKKWVRLRLVARYAGIPALLYFVFFALYTWPWMPRFSTHFFTDQGDGFQNVWNVWWINKAITELHQLPWQTSYLHYPYGTTLIAQTLNPFNGFMALPMLRFLTLVQAFNIMVIFSFVAGGLTMFWLCYNFTRRYIPSIIGGFIYTFSSYHFAHAIGHMQLVSFEWMPLFILLWWKLLTKPRYRTAAACAVVLLLVLLCDYYYFLYSLALAGMILVYLFWRKEIPSFKKPQSWRPWALFSVLSAILVLPLPLALTYTNTHDPLLGSHPSRLFSTDALAPFITGGFWRFHSLTMFYWRHVTAGFSESSNYLTFSVCVLLVIAIWKRVKIHKDIVFWLIVAVIFGVLSMGPRVMIAGISINHAPMPYAILERIVPPLKLSGVPVRMMVMVIFAAAIISAMVLAKLNLKQRKGQIVMAIFAIVLIFELWPNTMPINPVAYPKYVDALHSLPATGGVLDDAALSESDQLYHQTITEKPIVLGYISRTPTSVTKKDNELLAVLGKPDGYSKLCSLYKVRYYTTPASRPLKDATFPVLYNDGKAIIYDLKNSPNC